ncbi:MAG: glycoside hydrolase family 3 N-terminal domain-containing protein [bacterium]
MKNILTGIAFCLMLAAAGAVCGAVEKEPLYLDRTQLVDVRIKDLISRMTPEEKMQELAGKAGGPGELRLKIPPFNTTEAVHGYMSGIGATIFPHSIAMASSWNEKLMLEMADTIAAEMVAANAQQAWSPLMDVARDPRWGRMEETYGEDTYLVTRMGVAFIKGLQRHNLIATPKHFAAHGAPQGGRDSNDVGYSERVMREYYLPSFRAAFLEAGAMATMSAYSTWFDAPAVSSEYLLKGILREEWGFQGFIVSDCTSIAHLTYKHYVAADYVDAARLALKAGVSYNCGEVYAREDVIQAVADGRIPMADVDYAVSRTIRAKFLTNLFEAPRAKLLKEGGKDWNSPKHSAVALDAARQSLILLKNKDSLLPLSKNIKSIAIIGENAKTQQLGDYSAKPLEGQLVSILDGVKKTVGPDVIVRYAEGYDHKFPSAFMGISKAVKAARASDVAIVVVGDLGDITSGEGHDRADLDLPRGQKELVKAIYKTGTPVVLIIVSGRPYTIEWEADNIKAIIQTFYPGQEGGTAAAEVLFGDYNPAGRLPVTYPRYAGQLPLNYNPKPSGRGYKYINMDASPRYRFGHGLSYTRFRYSNLKVSPEKTADGLVTVSADIENIGGRDGDEVAQLYVTDMLATVDTPVSQLMGFSRVNIKAGEKATVAFSLNAYQLSLLDRNMDRVLEPGKFKVMVGGVSPWAQPEDRFKDRIGYSGPEEGVVGEFEATERIAANFEYSLAAPQTAKAGEPFEVIVKVNNKGRMTDVGEVKLFADGAVAGVKRFEVAPGKPKSLTFAVALKAAGEIQLTAVGKSGLAKQTIKVIQ